MATPSEQDIKTKLIQLRDEFFNSLPGQLDDIRRDYEALLKHWNNETLAELHRKTHSLAGSGGSFGVNNVSGAARALENALKKIITDKDTGNLDNIKDLLGKLEKQARLARPESGIHGGIKQDYTHRAASQQNHVYFVEDNNLYGNKIRNELVRHGFKVSLFESIDSFLSAFSKERPDAVIMDIIFPEGEDTGARTFEKIKQQYDPAPPLIFLSIQDDIQAQLDSVRLGACRYFIKPVNTDKLAETLKNLAAQLPNSKYRILIIDDDKAVGDFHAEILADAGMDVHVIHTPMDVLQDIVEFDPELILMDLYMPECDGMELASIIRQDDSYAQLPIVFLSAEKNKNSHLNALNLGADDFITKPVDPKNLIASVEARVKRHRHLTYISKSLDQMLHEREYQQMALNQHAIVSVADPTGAITYVNDKFCEISGYSYEELIGQNHRVIKSGEHNADFYKSIWKRIAHGRIWGGEICNRRKDGSLYWVESTIVPFLDRHGLPYQYVSIRTDITKLKETEKNLTHARDEAEKANQAKSEFLSSMSHELRTPMNAILGFGQLLEMDKDPGLTPSQLEYIHEIMNAGGHLLRLINDVLDLARIEAGRIDLSLEAVSLKDIISECHSLIAPLLDNRSIQLIVNEVDCKDVVFEADHVRLKQVMLNLLSNASKYNKEGGTITISCEPAGDARQRVSITDTGKGISAKDQQQLFSAFNRLDAERSHIEGTGIGLVITRNLVELMQGTMGVESTIGKGSTFWFELPVTNKPDLSSGRNRVADKPARNFGGEEKTVSSRFKVLYIEDNPANLRLVSILLARRDDIELATAPEPGLGLEIASSLQPNLILLDINLPNIDGYEVLRKLQASDDTSAIPVIAISANAMPADLKKGKKAGFVDYLTKPIDVGILMKTVDNVLTKEQVTFPSTGKKEPRGAGVADSVTCTEKRGSKTP